MALTDSVDIYCERIGTAFWAEPFNALSNAAFVLAALWALVTLSQRIKSGGAPAAPIDRALIALAALIGVGSFLFHTFANRWSEWADTLPIWSFVGLYVFAAITDAPRTTPRKRAITGGIVTLVVGYIVAMTATGEAAETNAVDPLNGSGQYAPALIALLIVTAIATRRRSPAARWFALATSAFLISLFFRTFDMAWCETWPVGTHFMWHLLNGLMVGFLLQARIRSPRLTAA
ncbi:ceramidase domain-containing protein [Celeribacter sp.]|uniref:ceramidase domain-containing protein n=1 Tax=Celeribacter sp. TaxID=1890673 RepID=UPI003A8E7D75